MKAIVTIGSLSTRTSKKGPNAGRTYTVAKKSIVRLGDEERKVTLRIFHPQCESHSKLLRHGRKWTVSVAWNGRGVLDVLGVDSPQTAIAA